MHEHRWEVTCHLDSLTAAFSRLEPLPIPCHKHSGKATNQHTTAMTHAHRQRHPNGTIELLAQLDQRFKLPDSWLDKLRPASSRQRTTSSTSSTTTRQERRRLLVSEEQPSVAITATRVGADGSSKAGKQRPKTAGAPHEYESWIYLTQVGFWWSPGLDLHAKDCCACMHSHAC
jgi:hypothetical protein